MTVRAASILLLYSLKLAKNKVEQQTVTSFYERTQIKQCRQRYYEYAQLRHSREGVTTKSGT